MKLLIQINITGASHLFENLVFEKKSLEMS